MANFLTLADMVTIVERNVKQFSGSKEDQIKSLINMVYLSEVMNFDTLRPFFWLLQWDMAHKSVGPSNISAITQDTPGQFTTAAAHGLSAGDIVGFYGVGGMTEINGQLAQVAAIVSTTEFTTDIDTSAYAAFTSGGRVFHRGITMPVGQVEIPLYAGWNGYTPGMEILTYEEIESDTRYHNLDGTGRPQHCFFGKTMAADGTPIEQIVWMPATDQSYLLRLWYRQPVVRLSEDTDVPLLPAQFHDVIPAGVIARLSESKDGGVGVEQASLWPTIYSAQLDALRKYNHEWWENAAQSKIVKHFLA